MLVFTCIALILVAVATLSNAFAFAPTKLLSTGLHRTHSLITMSSAPPPELDDRTREKIQTLVNNNKIILFMKGNKLFPQCGFSNTACRLLFFYTTDFSNRYVEIFIFDISGYWMRSELLTKRSTFLRIMMFAAA